MGTFDRRISTNISACRWFQANEDVHWMIEHIFLELLYFSSNPI